MDQQFSIVEEPVPVADYVRLREAVGWWPVAESVIAVSLASSPYCACVRDSGGHIVGMGRVVGDPMYLYVQDMIVLPPCRGLGLGRELMERILAYWGRVSRQGSFLGLMCARSMEPFYAKFGFEQRPPDGPGMQLIRGRP